MTHPCTCAGGSPADYDGPDRDCPEHGDVVARCGLRQGPYLLGRSYSESSKRVAAVQKLALETGTGSPALTLLTETLAAVASASAEELDLHLNGVVGAVHDFRAVVGYPSTYGIRPHTGRPEDDEKRWQFADAFPGYCPDGTCGACELKADGG